MRDNAVTGTESVVSEAFDPLDFSEFFGSNQNIIRTLEIGKMCKFVQDVIDFGSCGGIIYGRPRIGKTRAVQYCAEHLRTLYGDSLPIIRMSMAEHKPTERNFYSELLSAAGHPLFDRGTAPALRHRLISWLLSRSSETKYKRVIVFIDEAQNLTTSDYSWLINIYNSLDAENVRLTTLLVGTKELKAVKKSFSASHYDQIIGRFMVDEHEFKGIVGEEAIIPILLDVENSLEYYAGDERINPTKCFFPEAYEDGRSIVELSTDLWAEFSYQREKNGIRNKDIPMIYFMKTILILFKRFGKYGSEEHRTYFPEKKDVAEAIRLSGYLVPNDE